MNRTGLLIVLGVATLVGVVFGVYPKLDLWFAGLFYDPAIKDFPRFNPVLNGLRGAAMWLVAMIVAPAFLALALKVILPRRRMAVSGRAVVFLIATLAIGPGLIGNALLKSYWPRSRPIDVPPYAGTETFVPWWDPRGDCPKNCSFVAGEPLGAFWTMAPAALAPAPWRALAYGAAIGFGVAVGAMRIVYGAHFVTDVVFSGIIMFLIIWVMHGFIYRWRATRISDEAVELAIERLVVPLYDGVAAFGARRHCVRDGSIRVVERERPDHDLIERPSLAQEGPAAPGDPERRPRE